jgi:hypothetical protein
MTPVTETHRSLVVVARGPRAAEAELLRLILELQPRRIEDMDRKVRILVPSASLRSHVVSRLVGFAGRSLIGVEVQTLANAAQEVVGRFGDGARPAGAFTSILVRRLAAADPGLGSDLRALDDGYGIVEEAVRDLLDAGFGPHHAPVVAEKLRDLEGVVTADRLLRVAGVVKVTAELCGQLEAAGARRAEQAPHVAAELVRSHGAVALPARAVIIHGFADATGVASDFIQSVMSAIGGAVIVDRPPDPAAVARDDAGVVFLHRFETMLGGMAREPSEVEPVAPRLDLFRAPNAEAEVRQVAHRVRALLDDGLPAESIGVVAREIEREAAVLRTQFRRLGIPFSGTSRGSLIGGSDWRRARRLSAILRHGPEMPAELWLEASDGGGPSSDFGLALRTLGVVSLADAAGVASTLGSRRSITLPIPDAEEGEARRGRKIDASEVRRLAERAARLVEVFENWPDRASAAHHLRRVRRVVDLLGWETDPTADDPVLSAVNGFALEMPDELELDRHEFVEGSRRILTEVGLAAVGGAGGGVQLLSAMEARGRTFDELFLLGLNRGRFPRVVQEDALLPDAVRGHLAVEVLPEFPIKARGLDEERYLFAQLVASSAHVTLSWRDTVDGSKTAPSPFVERLRRELGADVGRAPAALSQAPDLEPRPAFEHAILAGHDRSRESLVSVLAETILEGADGAEVVVGDPMEWSLARVDVLEAIEPEESTDTPGPWAGLVGPVLPPGGSIPSVTGLEDVARCPWRAFVGRRLGISEMPDPRLGLPDTGGLLLGSVVHEVLQSIVDAKVGRRDVSLTELVESDAHDVPWPAADRLHELVGAAARRVAIRNGLSSAGVAPLLAARAMPVLEIARTVDWPGDLATGVLAAEVNGRVATAGDVEVRFRADRVDRSDASIVLTDYKAGKPVSTAKGETTRRDHLLKKIATGRALQAVAYALAPPSGLRGAGHYVALKPAIGDAPEESRRATVVSEDGEMVEAFNHAVETVVAGWRSGGLIPRVEEPSSRDTVPQACKWCPVAQACLRNDSGYRRRLVRWLRAEEGSDSEVEAAARDLWWLGVDRSRGDET